MMEIHPSIKANIDYWSQPPMQTWLAESPPFHTSYYAVDEGGTLRVYGVRWQGADLSKGEVFIPDNECDLLAEVAPILSAGKGRGMAIGEGITTSKGLLMVVDSYVFDSPLRRRKSWGPSTALSLLNERYVKPQAWSFKLDKTKWVVRFVDETEKSVTVLVEPKA